MPTALITGASAGLGAEFARQLARRRADLILVARTPETLEALGTELRTEYGVAVEILVADLAVESEVERVAARLRDTSDPVDLLINNAGFGLPLQFADNDIDDEVRHLRVHVEASMRLMHAALQTMRGRGGRIINVASVAGFISRSTYSACKSWLIGFSGWANAEYARDGVSVTALCPGFTHTSFHERMGLAVGEEGVPAIMWLNARDVVRTGLRDAARGRAVSVPSLRYKAIVALTRVLPRSFTSGVARRGRV
ncbi:MULTISPECIES: SDR family NAD(P)-dependent oxidoreductase [Microbacterium]|uniref:SDR family oxidoreductase n=1 Tax=Microbacterium aurugineum TaxID=2851642 RepID=A0ABY4J1N1_9MICO|nr:MULTISPECIES: SDR family oxidoreductase [Microbacterium]PKQ34111.1 MAG: NAD(P)-dependent oxidoreductase [Actinobacteria bacterium HGW-Actinobacteria-11]MCE0508082.1 SDR family oxidoreductase [Microbacterium sp. KKR3/1]MCK8477354.1 SDR family oxidoreductase [Microbacterium aurugineum]UPL17945.1 SDR family oxidoreductase [Microbacterium aurugineum]UUE22118.1 SDR family oxidoreductase [Microbacterium sp. J1-1]